MPSSPSFCEQIIEAAKDAITESGSQQIEIAQELGIAPSGLSRFLKGEQWPGRPTLEALAAFADLHVVRKRRGRARK